MKYSLFIAGVLLLAACSQHPASGSTVVPVSDLPTVSVRGKPGKGAIHWYYTLRDLREQRLTDLESYAEAGRFPLNVGASPEMAPVFVDARDVPCAVAYLMRQAGATQLVEQVRKENNLVRLWDLKSGPVLEWILSSGLTHEECALIQPSYEPWERPVRPRQPVDPSDDGYGVSVRHIQDHLRSTAKKLRADTAQSLQVALSRLNDHGHIAGGFCIVTAGSNSLIACPGTEPVVCAEMQIDASGKPVWNSNMSYRLPPGAVARIEWHKGAAFSIVEQFAEPTIIRGSPLG